MTAIFSNAVQSCFPCKGYIARYVVSQGQFSDFSARLLELLLAAICGPIFSNGKLHAFEGDLVDVRFSFGLESFDEIPNFSPFLESRLSSVSQ